MISTPLSTLGRWIVDSNGHRVKLTGANWAGGHQDQMVPGGLDYRNRSDIANQMAEWGFNSIRLTFALNTINSIGPVDPILVSANPDLVGSTPWQVFQAVANALTSAGIMVIPNCHLLFPGWCCSDADANGLWWNGNWPPAVFENTWLKVATAFASNPLVIGYDIKNEPRNATFGGMKYVPSWGDGNPLTDFCLMYSTTAKLIQTVDPGALFFCEGLGYAGNLTQAASHPVITNHPNKVIYSMHDYSWYHPANQSLTNYYNQMDSNGGYLLNNNVAPVWIGEFGDGNNDPRTFTSGWFANFATWAATMDIDWNLWQMCGTSRKGTTPTTNQLQCVDGQTAGYGLFASDWMGPANRVMMAALQALQPKRLGP